MESGLTIRPTTGVAETLLVRPEPIPVRSAVAITLAAPKSVTAASNANRSAGHDPAHALAHQQQMTREFVIDAQSREVISRMVDVRTGEVDHQFPDEALLRMRAYNRTLANGETPPENDPNTETEA